MKQNLQVPNNFQTYLLEDYTFLNQYELLDSPINTQTQFLAKIKSTDQLVKFVKKPFLSINTQKGLAVYKRFQAVFAMFQKGIVLADNMFILQEGKNQYYYYIIEPYFQTLQEDSPFITLQQFLFQNRKNNLSFHERKVLFLKCKNLFDKLSSFGQSYCGLTSRNIIVDDEGNVFFTPLCLQTTMINRPYERSYYPIQVIKLLQSNQNKQTVKSLHKWDLWSFGCIALQIFLYLTPFFISTSTQRQIQKISKQTCNIFKDFQKQYISEKQQNQNIYERQQGVQNLNPQKILNFFINVFNSEQNKRSISFQKPNIEEDNILKKTQRIKSSVRRLIEKSKENLKEKYQSKTQRKVSTIQIQQTIDGFKQLNVVQKVDRFFELGMRAQELYTFELKFKSFVIQDFQQILKSQAAQIKARVSFPNGQVFQFCIDYKTDEMITQILINKKITYSNHTMEFIDDLLEDDIQIKIQISTSQSVSLMFINLSSLTIRNDRGERMWKNPIKGSYGAQKESPFGCKLKIQANIILQHNNLDQNNKKQIHKKNIQKKNPTLINQGFQVQKIENYQKEDLIESGNMTSKSYQKEDQTIAKASTQQIQFTVSSKQLKQSKKNINKYSQSTKQIQEIEIKDNKPQTQEGFENKLQMKVKKLLKGNKENSRISNHVDLTKKLKRLLIS